MMTLLPLCLAFLSFTSVFSQENPGICASLNQIMDPITFQNDILNQALRPPKNLFVSVPGVTDRQCIPPQPGMPERPNSRDKEFCHLHNPLTGGPQQRICNRCIPQEINAYKYEIWKHINTANIELKDYKKPDGTFPFAFCLTCMAKAASVREAANMETPVPGTAMYYGKQYTIPTVPDADPQIADDWRNIQGSDARKPNITVTTAIQCGKQYQQNQEPYFAIPNPVEMEKFAAQFKQAEAIATRSVAREAQCSAQCQQQYGAAQAQYNACLLQCPFDPICTAPGVACSEAQFNDQQLSKQVAANITRDMNQYIMQFTQMETVTRDGVTFDRPVHGHWNDWMEIPFGHVHVVRSTINLNGGSIGYAPGIPDGRYRHPRTNVPYTGCQALEYGVTALSPGILETSCWLTPILTIGQGDGEQIDNAGLDAWRAEEIRKQQEVEAAGKQKLDENIGNLVRFCRDVKPQFQNEQNAQSQQEVIQMRKMYEHATKTCEFEFCIKQLPVPVGQKHPSFDAICSIVFADSRRFRAAAQAAQAQAQG